MVEKSFEKHDSILKVEELKSQSLVLDECVKLLAADEASLLKSFYLNKTKCETIANEAKTSVNAIRLKLSRLRSKLRKCTQLKLSIMEPGL